MPSDALEISRALFKCAQLLLNFINDSDLLETLFSDKAERDAFSYCACTDYDDMLEIFPQLSTAERPAALLALTHVKILFIQTSARLTLERHSVAESLIRLKEIAESSSMVRLKV